jgi:hypothetical protein
MQQEEHSEMGGRMQHIIIGLGVSAVAKAQQSFSKSQRKSHSSCLKIWGAELQRICGQGQGSNSPS